PRLGFVLTLPESVAARPEVEQLRLVRIHRQPLAIGAAELVAPHFEIHWKDFPGGTAIVRAHEGASPRPALGIHADGHGHTIGSHRVGREALDAQIVGVFCTDEIGQWYPT